MKAAMNLAASEQPRQLLLNGLLLLTAALPSIFFLVTLPPQWNFIDAFLTITLEVKQVIPHWPPIYPFITQLLHNFGAHGLNFLSYLSGPKIVISTQGIYAIILFQHALYIASLIYFVRSITDRPLFRILGVAVISGSLCLALYEHGIYSEAITIPLMFFQLGATLRLVNSPDNRKDLAVYFSSLTCGALTRHATALLACLAPLVFLLLWIWRRRATMRQFVTVVLTSGAAIVAVKVVMATMIWAWNRSDVPIYGRTGTYHMYYGWRDSTPEGRVEILKHVQSLSDDKDIQDAYPVIFNITSPWLEAHNNLVTYVQSDPARKARWDPDVLLNKLYLLYLTHPDAALLGAIKNAFMGYMNNTFSAENWTILSISANSAFPRYRTPDYVKSFASSDLFDDHQLNRTTQMESSWVLHIWDGITVLHLSALATLLVLVAALLRLVPGEQLVFASVCLFVSWINTFVLSLITLFLGRYAVPSDVLILAAIAVTLAGLGEKRSNGMPE